MTEKKTLDRAAILKHTKLETKRVEVPEWGGAVIVRELTGDERDAWEGSFLDSQGQPVDDFMEHARARLVALSVIDDKGDRIFSEDDVEKLGRLSARALTRVFSVSTNLSGLTREDLETLEKNLPAGRTGNSGSS